MPFISCEGLDGSGTTTLVESLEEEFESVTTTAEPSTLWTGKQVRRCLTDESLDPLTDFYFFMGDRVNHIEETVRPLDEQGEIVISDRYADSTRVYQPVALAESDHFDTQAGARRFIELTMRPWNYEPDVTVFIDISVDTALERADGEEKYENRKFLEQVRENYLTLVEKNPERFIVIDGEQSKDSVLNETLKSLEGEIPL